MPEENSAAEEHAIIQEVTAPLATLPDNAVPDVTDVEFPTALRGYDRLAVDAYVKRTSQLVAELQSTRSPEAAIRRALERVGEEVSGILQRAHEAAAQITAQSRSEAEDRLEMARQEAAQITVSARHQLKDLDVETDRIWAERQRIVEDAQELARQLLGLAESAAERFPPADDTEDGGSAEPDSAERPLVEPPVGASLNGDDLEHEQGPWSPQTGGEGSGPEQPGGEASWPEQPGGEGSWPEQPGGGAQTEATDEDQTVIMPPLRPDEGQET